METVFPTSEPDCVRFSQATGYAWGYSDATHTGIPGGAFGFATAYMLAGRDYDNRLTAHLPSVQRCYENWLATSGRTVWTNEPAMI